MKSSLLKIVSLCLLLVGTLFTSYSQGIILSKNAQISVLTCGLGNEVYSLFGHTAIRVSDKENNLDEVYNYGAFDFSTPNFVVRFAKGDLNYFITNNRYVDFLNTYNYERRDVYEQELDIPLDKKQKLYNSLAQALLSNERLYQYKFIDNNCTSKVVEVLNNTLGKDAITKKEDTDKTYRAILFPYFDNHFYEKLGTSIIFGSKVDQLGTKIFLPFELQKSLEGTQYQNHPISRVNKTILNFEEQPPHSWWNNSTTYLLILSIITLANKKLIDYIYLSIMGLFGVLFVVMGFYSLHQELAYNYNVLLFNPLLLALLYFVGTKNNKMTTQLTSVGLVMTLMYFCFMITKVHLFIVSPILITNLFVLGRLYMQSKKNVPEVKKTADLK